MDYYFKYLEILHLKRLTSTEVIQKLQSVFARNGIPEVLFTGNGPQLISEEMKGFAKTADFNLITRSLDFSQANGQAEAAVKIGKNSGDRKDTDFS